MYVSHEHRLVYYDPPKCASVSLMDFFYRVDNNDWSDMHVGRFPGIFPRHGRETHGVKDYLRVASVRNPYHRALSFWLDNRRDERDPWTEKFDDFVSLLLEWDAVYDTYTGELYEYQFFNQTRFLEPVGYDYLIKVENLNKDVMDLMSKLGITQYLLPARRNWNTDGSTEALWNKIKTPRLIKRLNEWAGLDFGTFGYERET